MNKTWLMEVADIPIKRNLGMQNIDFNLLLENEEVAYWYSQLEERAKTNNIGEVHGSHDYRMENILGKCFVLGLSRNDEPFARYMSFIIRFLEQHVQTNPGNELSYAKLYHFRDYEKVLCCYLPFLGYQEEPIVQYIVKKRIDIIYNFTKQKRYDIYDTESEFPGVKKEWKPYVIKPSLYANGNISLPDMHDVIMFAGMYPYLSKIDRSKVESIVEWFFGTGYRDIIRRYGYFYVPNDRYNAKAIIFKPHLIDFQYADVDCIDKADFISLVFHVFMFSHFQAARKSSWFQLAMDYLDSFRCDNGHYLFTANMLVEKKDSYVIKGGHMNVGENKKGQYREIISTYWMEKIEQVIQERGM